MKKGFAFILMIMVLAGCGLFQSEDLDNETEADVMNAFLEATYAGDSEMASKLALLDEDKVDDIIETAKEEGLKDADVDACQFEEADNLQYDAVCETTDEMDVFMTFTLKEDDDAFFVKNASLQPAVAFAFTQDAPELTEEYIERVENMIQHDLYMMDEDEKQDMKYQSHELAEAVRQFLKGNTEDIIPFFDLDSFMTDSGETPSEDEMITYLDESLSYKSEDVETQEILFGSEYDKIEMLQIASEADYTMANEEFPVSLKDNPTIEIQYKGDHGEMFYFSGEFTVEDGDLTIGAYGFEESSILNQLQYDIQSNDSEEDDGVTEEEEEEDEEEEMEEEEVVSAGEEAYKMNCASCHGIELSGGVGPDLTTVGDNFTEDEIMDIIENGTGDMPPMIATPEEAEAIAEWLLDQEEEN